MRMRVEGDLPGSGEFPALGCGWGVRVIGDRVQVGSILGNCSPRIWVDGLPQSINTDFPLDFIAPFEALAVVEVYRRATEVPLQYGGTGAGCGVILFWTKTGS